MLDPVSLFREGGPFMYVLLLVGLVLPPAVLLSLALQAARVRVPAVVWSLLAAAPFVFGAFGTWLGFGMALQAAAHVSPEMLAQLSAQGLAVGLYTVLAGAVLSGFAFSGFALALGVGAILGTGAKRRWNPGGAVALVGLGFALGLLLLGRFVGGFVTGQAAIGLALAGLADSEDEEHAERLVAAKGAAGGFGVAGVLASVFADLCMVAVLYHQAIALASAEMRPQLMYRALQGTWMATGVGLTAALVFGLITTGLLALRLPQSTSSRTLGSAAVAVLPVLAMLAGGGLLVPRGQTLADFTVSQAAKRAPVLAARGVELPRLDLELHKPLLRGRALTVTRDEATVDDRPAEPGVLAEEEYVTVEVATGTPIRALRPWAEVLVGADVDFAVQARNGLQALEIPIDDAKPHPKRSLSSGIPDRFVELAVEEERPEESIERFEGVWTRSGWVLGRYDGREREGYGTVGEAELGERLAALDELYPEVGKIHVWLKDEAQIDDLIGLVGTQVERGLADREASFLWVTWRIDAAPELPAPAMEPTGDGEDGEAEDTGDVADGEEGDGAEGEEGEGEEAEARRGLVTFGEVTLTGSLDRTEMNQVLGKARARLSQCFTAPGSATLKLTVGKTGAVQSSVLRETTGEDAVDVCLVRVSQRLRFAPPKGGGIAILSVPLEAH